MYRLFTFTLSILACAVSTAQLPLIQTNNYLPQINGVRDVLSGDINGDSFVDLLVVSEHTAGIIIYLNDGSNQFVPSSNPLNTGVAKDALLEDFDGDGDLDIWAGLLSGEFEDFDALYVNDGSGEFTKTDLDVSPNIFFTGTDELISGDLDNNGSIDVVRILRRSDVEPVGLFVFKNSGPGTFEEFEINIDFGVVRLADFNQDDLLDIWSFKNGGLTVFLNDGNGLFNNDNKIETEANIGSFDSFLDNLILSDIDNDGNMDIQTFSTQFYLPRYINNGDGTFTSTGVIVYSENPGNQVGVFLDVDNDQDLDIWFGHDTMKQSVIAITGDNGEIDINANFVNIPESQVNALLADDFDKDGDLDVVSVGVDGISLWQNVSLGEFELAEQNSVNNWGEFNGVQLADMNNDNFMDLVMTGESGVEIADGNGRGGFSAFQKQYQESIFRSHTTDFNGDGYADVAVIKNGGGFDLLLNDQAGGLAAQMLDPNATTGYKISSGDFDNDGDIDLMVQEFLGSILIFSNQENSQFEKTQTINGGFSESALVDINQNGEVVLIAQNVFDFFGESTVGVIEYKYSDGSLRKTKSAVIENMFYENLVFFDQDDDGDLDILTNKPTTGGYVTVINNDESFAEGSLAFPGYNPSQAIDFNLDALTDLVTDSGEVYLNTNNGFEAVNEDSFSTSAQSFVLGDLDQDSDPDLVLIETDTGLTTQLNTTIDKDFSGLWYNPQQDGHGIQVEQINTNGMPRVVVSWYVYEDGEQLWLTGTGTIENDSSTVQAFITSGPNFGSEYDVDDYDSQPWGTMTLSLTEPNRMNFQWDGSSLGYSQGEMVFQRFVAIKPVSKKIVGINSCHSGSWYEPATNGQGFMAQVIESNGVEQMVMTWYTYSDGEQYWLTGLGPIDGNLATLDVQATTGADFPPAFAANDVQRIPWGEIVFELNGDYEAKVSWRSLLTAFPDGEMTVQKLTLVDRYQCN